MALNASLRSVGLLSIALFLFAILDALAKHLADHVPVLLLVWGRYLAHCLLMLIFLGPRLGRGLVHTRRPLRQVIRALCLLGCTWFGFAALSRLPLAECTATFFVSPLLVALLAGPWLGERLRPAGWIAIVGGLAGVLLIARPAGEIQGIGLAYALCAAGCYAVYQILTRQLAPNENAVTMLFYTALVGTVASSLVLPWGWEGALPDTGQCLQIVSLGILGGSGHFLLIHAYRRAEASLLAPFFYLQLVWATLIGAVIFTHWPALPSLAGMAIIAGSGLYLGVINRQQRTPG